MINNFSFWSLLNTRMILFVLQTLSRCQHLWSIWCCSLFLPLWREVQNFNVGRQKQGFGHQNCLPVQTQILLMESVWSLCGGACSTSIVVNRSHNAKSCIVESIPWRPQTLSHHSSTSGTPLMCWVFPWSASAISRSWWRTATRTMVISVWNFVVMFEGIGANGDITSYWSFLDVFGSFKSICQSNNTWNMYYCMLLQVIVNKNKQNIKIYTV